MKSFWARHVMSEAILLNKLAEGKTMTTIAAELSVEFNDYVSSDAAQKRILKTGRPPLKEGVVKIQLAGGANPLSFWGRNPESLDRMRLEAERGQSSHQIADTLTTTYSEYVSRNMVLGKINRIKNTNKKITISRFTTRAQPPRICAIPPARLTTRPESSKTAVVPSFESLSLAIWDLPETRSCRWIVSGDPRIDVLEIRYCGISTESGKSFCVYHRAIAEQPRRPRSTVDIKPFYRGRMLR